MQINKADDLVKLISDVTQLLFNRQPRKDELILLIGTVAIESGWDSGFIRKQYGGGPARGIVQMEGNTAVDIFKNYLVYKKDMYDKVISVMTNNKDIQPFKVPSKKSLEKALETDDRFAMIMARLLYLRVPEQIPTDIISIANYYKKYYNTIKGKSTADMFISRWNYYKCNKILERNGY
jgi:hypothetical protein